MCYNELLLAEHIGANTRVVEHFAFIHDLGRENDYEAPHRLRAAEMAGKIAGDLIDVTKQELFLLRTACDGYSDGHLEADFTVMTCWDADRLDLGKLGIKPDPERLCTAVAREPGVVLEAYVRSLG